MLSINRKLLVRIVGCWIATRTFRKFHWAMNLTIRSNSIINRISGRTYKSENACNRSRIPHVYSTNWIAEPQHILHIVHGCHTGGGEQWCSTDRCVANVQRLGKWFLLWKGIDSDRRRPSKTKYSVDHMDRPRFGHLSARRVSPQRHRTASILCRVDRSQRFI